MSASATLQPTHANPPILSTWDGWTMYEHRVVTSTNLVAANLPPWHAVRADIQTSGRGRFQRAWISDEGGLWLSAVVPIEAETIKRRALPLAAGLAMCDSLRELGVSALRMRWPNDVLVHDRKLAGLLIDHFVPGLAVIGIGINVRNQPETFDPTLRNQTTRLLDLLPDPGASASRQRVRYFEHSQHAGETPALPWETQPPKLPTGCLDNPQSALELRQLTRLILRHIRLVLTDLEQAGTMSLLLRVNKLWAAPRRVELDLDGTFRCGLFMGVDEEGRLALLDETGTDTFYEAHQVRHLTEI